METLLEMFRRGDKAGIWKRYCGSIDLSMDEFMETQNRLLADQLQAWQRSPLVKRLFGGTIPASVKEFRGRAPLTTYEDYADVLLEKSEKELPESVFTWVRTSGRSGQFAGKWIPWTRGMYEAISDDGIGTFLLASCRKHGEITLKEHDRLMFTLAPLPYSSGLVMRAMHEQFNFRFWPPYEEAVAMDFFERMREAVRLAFSEGIDYFFGISSLMISLSEQFEDAGKSGASPEMKKMVRTPKVFLRLLKGVLKSKIRGGHMRPSDLWKPKGIVCGGMDTATYRERIRALWGDYPREIYACSEFGVIGNQHFAGFGTVPCVKSCYFEFLELEDYARWKADRSYRPRLLVLSEVKAGKGYALVGTNFFGGVLVRHVLGDEVKFFSLADESIGLRLPQLGVSGRIDDVIDIGGFTRLTERTIWSAIESSGIPYTDWVVAKEVSGDNPVLHLYLETKGDGHDPVAAQAVIHEKLKLEDHEYRDLEEMAGIKPLVVTLLSRGTFARFQKERQAAGYEIAHLKPVHMGPRDEVISRLVAMSAMRI
jgi:GH3 auxin-responsive promoter